MTDVDYGRPMSAQDAARTLGIPAGTVRSWFCRRRTTGLYDIGRDRRGHPLFWEADLLALQQGKRLRDDQGARLRTTDGVASSGAPVDAPCVDHRNVPVQR